MESRKKQCEFLSERIEEANNKINSIIDRLGWDREELKQFYNYRQTLKTCPINKRHKIPSDCFEKHCKQCTLKSNGIYVKRVKKNKMRKERSSLFFYQKNPSVISFALKKPSEPYENTINTDFLKSEQLDEETVTGKLEAYDKIVDWSNKLRK